MTPQAESILELFRSTGAYLEGHFRLTSGLHSSQYLQCALVLQHPLAAEKLGRLLAAQLRGAAAGRIDLVASPALGGLIIGHEVARSLKARFLIAECPAFEPGLTRGGVDVLRLIGRAAREHNQRQEGRKRTRGGHRANMAREKSPQAGTIKARFSGRIVLRRHGEIKLIHSGP